MFRRKEKSPAMIFEFGKETREAIHSFFVFSDFIAVWLDDAGTVIELKKLNLGEELFGPKIILKC